MYNFYQYEKARNSTLQNDPMISSISSTVSPKATLMASKMRSKSYMANSKQDVKHSSVEVRRKSEFSKPRSPHEKRDKLVESYKSRVANFIKDVSKLFQRGFNCYNVDDRQTHSRI